LKVGSFLSVKIGGLGIFPNLVELGLPKDPIERTMLSRRVAAVCSAGGALVWLVRAALASAACRRAVSCSISACWFAAISTVSVVGVSTVRELED
jgi:hypothetical protein